MQGFSTLRRWGKIEVESLHRERLKDSEYADVVNQSITELVNQSLIHNKEIDLRTSIQERMLSGLDLN